VIGPVGVADAEDEVTELAVLDPDVLELVPLLVPVTDELADTLVPVLLAEEVEETEALVLVEADVVLLSM
jgi:hypothetical protein